MYDIIDMMHIVFIYLFFCTIYKFCEADGYTDFYGFVDENNCFYQCVC